MAEQDTEKRILTPDRVNLIVAGCAVLISAASFYATFLQADSAEKQVRAMTLPLIQFVHGNYDPVLEQNAVSFTLKNAGVGPAIIKSVQFNYLDSSTDHIWGFIGACCESEYKAHKIQNNKLQAREMRIKEGGVVTSTLSGLVLPGQSDYEFMKVYSHDSSGALWEKLNKERWHLKLDVCYCSMLDDCFRTRDSSVFQAVEACPVK